MQSEEYALANQAEARFSSRLFIYLPAIFIIPLVLLVYTLWPSEPYTLYIADPVQRGLDGSQAFKYQSLPLSCEGNVQCSGQVS